ncbi:hypothetical protein PENTCL1PPCAC_24135, partial [Pristionchus entomophagus]
RTIRRREYRLEVSDAQSILGRKMRMIRKRSTSESERMPTRTKFEPQHISGAITHKVTALLHRFSFKRIIIHQISIDDHFLAYLERVVSVCSLILMNIVFDKNLHSDGCERFRSLLFSAKPYSIKVGFACEYSIMDERFLREYAQTVRLPSLYFYDNPLHNPLVRPAVDFAEILSEFRTLHSSRLLINTDLLIEPLLKRLGHRRKGRYDFLVTRGFTQREIAAAIQPRPGMQYTLMNGVAHHIEITGTPHKARITVFGNVVDHLTGLTLHILEVLFNDGTDCSSLLL